MTAITKVKVSVEAVTPPCEAGEHQNCAAYGTNDGYWKHKDPVLHGITQDFIERKKQIENIEVKSICRCTCPCHGGSHQ